MGNMIFITGFPRSGTTLLAAILNRHADVCVTPETCYFEEVQPVVKEGKNFSLLMKILKKSRCKDLDLDFDRTIDQEMWQKGGHKIIFEEILKSYTIKKNKTVAAEKSPIHLLRIDKIFEIYNDAKIVVILRDGRAAVHSLLNMPWGHNNLIRYSGEWCYWMNYLEECQKKYPKQIITVKYEDLVDDQSKTIKIILSFLKLEYLTSMLESKDMSDTIPQWEMAWKAQSAGPVINKKDIWLKDTKKKDVQIMESIMGKNLQKLGYELNNQKYNVGYAVIGKLFSLPIWYLTRSFFKRKKILYGN